MNAMQQSRTFVGVAIAGIIAVAIYETVGSCQRNDTGWCSNIEKGLLWSAMSTVLVASAEVGTTADKGNSRVLGTLIGGIFGAFATIIVRKLESAGGLFFVFFCAGSAFVFKFGSITYTGNEYAGSCASITTLIILWIGYQEPRADVWLVATSRTGGILLGVFIAQWTSEFIFPVSLSASVLKGLSENGASMQRQSDMLWTCVLAIDAERSKAQREKLREAFYADPSRARTATIRGNSFKAQKLEVYAGKCLGSEWWLARRSYLKVVFGKPRTLDAKSVAALLKSSARLDRHLDTCFGVVDDLLTDAVLVELHGRYRVGEHGGVSALRKIRDDTQKVLAGIEKSCTFPFPSVPPDLRDLVVKTTRFCLEQEEAEVADKQPPLPIEIYNLDGKVRRFRYRWNTFLLLYHDFARELVTYIGLVDAWVLTLPHRPKNKASASQIREAPLPDKPAGKTVDLVVAEPLADQPVDKAVDNL